MKKVMFTSIPSTGTNLMHKYFRLVGFKRAEPIDPHFFDESLWEYVRNLQPGYYSAWHYTWYKRLSDILRQNAVRAVFICRDPRAQACAMVHHYAWNTKNPLHKIFMEHLKTDDERLLRVIEGLPPDEFQMLKDQGGLERGAVGPPPDEGKGPGSRYPSGLNNIYRNYARWFDDPSCYCVRFEDIIGPKGGGDRETQVKTLAALMEYTGVCNDMTDPEAVADQIFDTKSPTFRKGRIDSWREEMSPEVYEVFLRECGEVLKMWGYQP